MPTFARRARITVLALLLPLIPAAGSTPARGQEAARPNILIILTDDQRATGTLKVMPEVRRWFAEGGTLFTDAFATTPVCCPSRASIMTGRYAHNHGVLTNDSAAALQEHQTIQRYLHDAGYQTGYIGKFLNAWGLPRNPQYFDRWGLSEVAYFDPFFNVDGEIKQIPGYSTTIMADLAIEFLEDFAGRPVGLLEEPPDPWFLVLATMAPHRPREPEPSYASMEVGRWGGNPAVRKRDRRGKPLYVRSARAGLRDGRRLRQKQLRTLLSVDDLVERVFLKIEELDDLGDTLAVFVSDNGFTWAEHGLLGKGVPYTDSIRIPLLMRWPGRVQAGAANDGLVANVDIAPTIMEAAGLQPDAEYPMDGRSLLSPTDRRFLLFERYQRRPWASLRSKSYQYIEYYGPRGGVRFREFYPLSRDPWQLVNLFGDKKRSNDPDKRALHRLLIRAGGCVGTDGPTACP